MKDIVTTTTLILIAGVLVAPAAAAKKPIEPYGQVVILTPAKGQSMAVDGSDLVITLATASHSASPFAPGHGGYPPPGQQPPCPDGRGHSCEAPGHLKISPN